VVLLTGVEGTGAKASLGARALLRGSEEATAVLLTGVEGTASLCAHALLGGGEEASAVLLTGVEGTGAEASLGARADTAVLLTGVEGTASLCAHALLGGGEEASAVLLTGVEGTGAEASLGARADTAVLLTGVEGTGVEGAAAAWGKAAKAFCTSKDLCSSFFASRWLRRGCALACTRSGVVGSSSGCRRRGWGVNGSATSMRLLVSAGERGLPGAANLSAAATLAAALSAGDGTETKGRFQPRRRRARGAGLSIRP